MDNVETPESILHRIDWQVIRRLDGLMQGDYRTLFYGAGIDFADLREYQPNDDIRHIDWNVTARMNNPFVRQYVEDREITAWFFLDMSPSMGFGVKERPKARVLLEIVTTLARLLTRGGNKVGAILYKNKVERTISPRGGKNQVLRLTKELQREGMLKIKVATNLKDLLAAGFNTLRRRSLVVLISDFISEPGWEKPLALLNQRHELLAIRLTDPREITLPDAGLIVVEDSETGEQLTVDTGNLEFRRRFAEAAAAREKSLQESLKRAGVDLFGVSTEDDLVPAIVRIAAIRKRRIRRNISL